MAEDKRKNNGGHKTAGRKTKAKEDQANHIFIKAMSVLYEKEDTEEAKIEFVKKLLESQRGQIFVAEHVFGKPETKTDITSGGEVIRNIINLGKGINPDDGTTT